MNNEIKEAKKISLEAKFKNKEELAQAKAALVQSAKIYKKTLKKASLEEKKLRLQLKREETAEKQQLAKKRKQNSLTLKEEKKLILENKKAISLEKSQVRHELLLIRKEQKAELLKAKKANNAKLANIKSEINHQRIQQKKQILEAREKNKEKLADTKQEIEKAKSEAIKFKLESEKLIASKKEELSMKKGALSAKVMNLKEKAQHDRAVRYTEKLKANQELKELQLKAYEKHKYKVLELKGKFISYDEERARSDKEYRSQIDDAKNELEKQKLKSKEINLEIKEAQLEQQKATLEVKLNTKQTKKQIISKEKTEVIEKPQIPTTIKLETSDFNSTIETEVLKGEIIEEVGKAGIKLYEKANTSETKLNISKLKMSDEIISSIKMFQELKDKKDLIDIREFAKYISYLLDLEFSKEDMEKMIISAEVSILKGKALLFLNGYFRTSKIKGHKFVIYETKLSANVSPSSLPETEFRNTLEKLIIERLNQGAVIQLSNNLALQESNGTIKVLCDLPILEM